MKKIIIICFFSILIIPTILLGQKKVLGKPLHFDLPIDFYDGDNSKENLTKFWNSRQRKSQEEPWMVISDRNNNKVYKKASLGSSVVETINFRDYFYVVEDKDDWVKIVEASVDKLEIVNLKRKMGWIPKANLLLWNSGLVGKTNQIHKKVLLLNKAEDIKNILSMEDKSIVNIYSDPTNGDKLPDKRIFDFYFVMKKDFNTGRYLLAGDALISAYNVQDKIIGWVDARRCALWNTRICLEPNFEESAFNERKSNPDKFKVRAFEEFLAAKEFAEGSGAKNDVFWEDDPIQVTGQNLSSANPHRFNGAVIRFPMISAEKTTDKYEYYNSGIIGTITAKNKGVISSISETAYAKFKEYTDLVTKKSQNVNVFFVVEGTASTAAFKNNIIESIRDINSSMTRNIQNVNYGALVYRDIMEERDNRLIEYTPLSVNINSTIDFLNRTTFENHFDQDEYTALYYGLAESLKIAGFRQDATNIIVVIGAYGDFRIDRDRRVAAKQQGHKAFFEDTNPIIRNLNALEAHLHFVQLNNDGYRTTRSYAGAGQALILEAANYGFNTKYGSRSDRQTRSLLTAMENDYNIRVSNPEMLDPSDSDDIQLQGGITPGSLRKPSVNNQLSQYNLSQMVQKGVEGSIIFAQDFHETIQKFVGGASSTEAVGPASDKSEVASGRFTPAFANWLNQIMKDGNISEADLNKSQGEKFRLFTEVFIPRYIKGATYPTVSYTLFMPERDLVNYQRILERMFSTSMGSYDQKREALFEIYIELITQFTGEEGLRGIPAERLLRSQIVALMQGLFYSGLRIDLDMDVMVGDIKDEQKVSNAEVDALLNRFNEVNKTLENIIRSGNTYEFCYSTDANNRYYWIPLEDSF